MHKNAPDLVKEGAPGPNAPKKPSVFSYLFVGLSAAVLLFYIFFVEGAGNVAHAFAIARKRWLLAALLFIFVYWLLEAFILHIPLTKLQGGCTFGQNFQVSMCGQYFNCITPLASGGQPMQAYQLVKMGVSVGVATGALLLKFIVYQTVLTFYSLFVLLFKYREITRGSNVIATAVIVGFLLNLAVDIGLISIGIFQGFTKRAAKVIIAALSKVRLIKDKEKTNQSVAKQLEDFHYSFGLIRGNLLMLCYMVLGTIVQLTVFFFIPYLIYGAFGLSEADPFTMLAACANVFMVSSFLPVPGGAEVSFAAVFSMFFPGSLISAAVLMWRMATFYAPIAVGAFFAAKPVKKTIKLRKKNYSL